MNKKEFIEVVGKAAQENYREYGILPSLVIAQAILESGWGDKAIENNIFGIKAGSYWTGKITIRETKEWDGCKYFNKKAKFRAYDSIKDSIRDYLELIGKSKRYKRIKEAKDYREAVKFIYEAGYATDPKYGDKLIQIIEYNKLYQYDKIQEPLSPWAVEAWEWAMDNGITDGTNPKDNMTREQGVTMLYRLINE
ncbi:glucosaminidase domain-containing protein [Schnuerera sp. xch1]|uniref:glycoside hydrolase family 73 protein n=1 Tax=Schnuerera sp. xch1 TaxID=2874283 RepID=UPI001CBFB590|nr:glucosaminidase domain-containing protein [Schnuerera sp. xch1]MBZ2175137.1 glucosaminidase domain-containing protein [Schnuerera sp. xch1]